MSGANAKLPSPPYSASKAGVSNCQYQKDAAVKGAKYRWGVGGGGYQIVHLCLVKVGITYTTATNLIQSTLSESQHKAKA
jgi:hypothetical protein